MSTTSEMPHVWTVGELTAAIRASLEGVFRTVDVEGEVSGCKVYPSGHAYFTLKDGDAQLAAVFFRNDRAACPEADAVRDGAKLKVRGRITAGLASRYQIVVRRVKPVGEGELMAKFLALKAKLEAEGLFDPARKPALPFLPRRIGLVTSPAGAVVHDMCRVLMRRFPALEIRIFPATVQGEQAPASLIAGLDHFDDAGNPWRADLVILARGGGSFEDLFCFNDEALVRRVAAMKVPVISAVGHETDFTLCDFASARRAGTPSIAAEIAVPTRVDLVARIESARQALVTALRGKYEWSAQRLDKLSDALSPALRAKAQDFARRLDGLATTLASSLELRLVRTESRLKEAGRALELLSPYGVLERGYSLTTGPDGEVLRDSASVAPGARLSTRLAKGTLSSVVTP